MRDPANATTATAFRTTQPARDDVRSLLVQRAPGPEAPDSRDRTGARKGMMIMLAGGGAFWGGVTALAVYLLR